MFIKFLTRVTKYYKLFLILIFIFIHVYFYISIPNFCLFVINQFILIILIL